MDRATITLLLDAGANVNATDSDGATPLMYAAASGRTAALKALASRGANINALGRLSKHSPSTALHYAASAGHSDAIRELLRHGADANARNADGMTPLMWGAYGGDLTSINMLLDAGADPNARSNEGTVTVWDRAIYSRGRGIDVVRVLITRKADINLRNKDGYTPLHFAVMKSDIDIARLLLANGADPNAMNKYGRSALDSAKLCVSQSEKCRALEALLREFGAAD